ncbi:MAG TPA: FGGY-family carbohydrate kinase [Rectinemataceae bacterium]|nr:FGGY-family carbohydrate kinase [Rectinemataceae bacterium]
MKDKVEVLAVDIGTTGAKTCVYSVGENIELRASAQCEYPIRLLPDGGAEQDPEDWWRAACEGARRALAQTSLRPSDIRGIAFCCQMQGLVLVDQSGRALRPAMSYMDQRAVEEKRLGIEKGIKIEGMNLRKLIPSLLIAGGVSASVKDPVWKYLWVRNHEPQVFEKIHKWLDVKEYLVARATGRFAMTPDSANATFFYDTRPGRAGWNKRLCGLFGVDIAHFPEVVGSTDVVAPLRGDAAAELGLEAGTPVFGGGGDLSLIALGSGAVALNQAHVYMGTSGWVAASVDRRTVDTNAMAASVLGAIPGRYNYISEQETSGKCMEWMRDHLALDEIGLYLGARNAAEDPEARFASIYDFLDETIESVPPGADGVVFAPWLHGSRSPFEDPNARGLFFNIGIETGKRCLVRAVAEGLALQCRWQLDAIRRKVPARGPLRFVGGGARSRTIGAMIADATGEVVETPENPQNSGTLGAAMICAAGLGVVPSLGEAAALVPLARSSEPREENRAVYERHYAVLKKLYYANKDSFRTLNSRCGRGESE